MALSCYYSYAQTNIFPPSGNVGIGTTSPTGGNLVTDIHAAGAGVAIAITNTTGGNGAKTAIAFGGTGTTAGIYGL